VTEARGQFANPEDGECQSLKTVNWKDLEGSGHGLMEELCRHFP
jgi:hypothetical protein